MPNPYSVRRLRPEGLERILEIEHASFRNDAYDRKLFASYLQKCGAYFLVAYRGGNACAYMLTCPGRAGRAELVSVAVDPAARGQGAASALMDSTLRRLRRAGIARFELIVKVTNRRARKLYEKYGFERIRRVPGYYEDGRDGWLMEKALRGR